MDPGQHRPEAIGRCGEAGRPPQPAGTSGSGSDGSITVPGPRNSSASTGFAAVRGAVGLEGAEVAEATGLRLEVFAAARVGDGVVERGSAAFDTANGLVGGRGDDRLGLREVVELHPRRAPAEHALAQERVHVHAGQALGLPQLRRHRAGLVVGDHELAVLVELEPVDDAAQARAAEVGFELQLEADGADRAGILELEVLADQRFGVGVEVCPFLLGEHEVGEVGVGGELDACRGEVGERGVDRAFVGRAVEEELEGPVHERALGGPRCGGLREALEVRETERERALLERRAGARRQRPGGREAHGSEGTSGV